MSSYIPKLKNAQSKIRST